MSQPFSLNPFNIPQFSYGSVYPFKFPNQYTLPQTDHLGKSKQELEEPTKHCENTYRTELISWVKKQNINELAVTSKAVTSFILRMFFHDMLQERSNYALNEKINRYPLITEKFEDFIFIRKRRQHEEEGLHLEQKLLSNVYIVDQDNLFDTFCLRGSLEDIIHLLIECSNNLAFSSQPKVGYNNITKQYHVNNAIWFNPNTYQTCSGWIINECEKAVALLYFKHTQQGYTQEQGSIKEFSNYWSADADGQKKKILNQISQICKEFKNAPKKKKSQIEDILWAQYLFSHKNADHQIDEEAIIKKFSENQLEQVYYMNITSLLKVQSLGEKRVLRLIKESYKDKILKDIQNIEQKEKEKEKLSKSNQEKKPKKSKLKKSKSKIQDTTPSTSSHKDYDHSKTLNIQELVESLQKINQNRREFKENPKASNFTTPPNSPSDQTPQESNQSFNLHQPLEFPFIQDEPKEATQNDQASNDEGQWQQVFPKHQKSRMWQRKFSSQMDLNEKPKKNKVNSKLLSVEPLKKQQSEGCTNQKSNPYSPQQDYQFDPKVISSQSSQENDSLDKEKAPTKIPSKENLERANSPPQAQPSNIQNAEPSATAGLTSFDIVKDILRQILSQNLEESERRAPLEQPKEVTTAQKQAAKNSSSGQSSKNNRGAQPKQSQRQNPEAVQEQKQPSPREEPQEIDPAVMEVAFGMMIKKLDMDMREMTEHILCQNEQILPIRQLIYKRLEFVVSYVLRDHNSTIRLFGSCATGLALSESDIDFGITGFELCPTTSLTNPLNQLIEYLSRMKWVKNIRAIYSQTMPLLKLQVDPWVSFSEISQAGAEWPGAKNFSVPMIDLAPGVGDEVLQKQFSVDLSFFSYKGPKTYPHLGQISTEYTLQWLQFYQELRPLTLLFKTLLKRRGLNDQYKGGISSFCIVQLVLAFLESLYQSGKVGSIGHTTYKFLEFYGTLFDPQVLGISFKGYNEWPFYELPQGEDKLEITIYSSITSEVISQGCSFVQTILQDLQTLYQATQNEIKFFYEKIKFNKKKKGKKEERNLFYKELNKLVPLFSNTVYNN